MMRSDYGSVEGYSPGQLGFALPRGDEGGGAAHPGWRRADDCTKDELEGLSLLSNERCGANTGERRHTL